MRHDFTLAELGEGARKKQFPLSQLPVLEILQGETRSYVSQSGTIMRYLATKLKLTPEDPLEAAQQDSIFELSQEFAKVNPYVNLYSAADLPAFLEKGAGNGSGYPIKPQLHAASVILGEKPFFGKETPAYADFNMWHYLDNIDTLVPGILDDFPNLKEYMVRLARLDGVKQYLQERPQLGDPNLGKDGAPIRDASKIKEW